MGIKLEDDNCCFVCGKQNPAGLNLDFSHLDGKASAEFILLKTFQGYRDVAHGGVIAAILDEAMVKAALSSGTQAVTAEITVRFISPLYTGEKALVEAEIVKTGKKLIEAKAQVRRDGSGIIAEASGKLINIS